MKHVHIVGLSILLMSAMPAQAQMMLTAVDIQKALKDKRVSLTCVDGSNGSGRYTMQKNSGTISGVFSRAGAGQVSDSGEVRAAGDSLCIKFKLLNQGQEQCFGVSRADGQGYSLSVDGVKACNVSVK